MALELFSSQGIVGNLNETTREVSITNEEDDEDDNDLGKTKSDTLAFNTIMRNKCYVFSFALS